MLLGARTLGLRGRHANNSLVGVVGSSDIVMLTTVVRTTAQSINHNSWTTISWSSAPDDEVGGTWSAGAPTDIVVPNGYTKAAIAVLTNWASGSASVRWTALRINGATVQIEIKTGNFENDGGFTTREFAVVAGDVITLQVLQVTGSARNFGGSGRGDPYIQVEWGN
jgi:hypothetical protein